MTETKRWIDRFENRIMIGLAGATLAVTLLTWQCPKVTDTETSFPPIYSLRINVLTEAGEVVRNSTVDVSAGNEPQLLDNGWWEIEIPEGKVPANRTVTVVVGRPGWKSKLETVELGTDPNINRNVELKTPRNPLIGTVLDEADRPVAGARVQVKGQAIEVVETSADGRFTVVVPLAEGEKVSLHLDHAELGARSASCYVGAACEIWLRPTDEPGGE